MAWAASWLPALLLLLPVVAAEPAEEAPAVTAGTHRGVAVFAGGIGSGVRDAWSVATKDYDLKLVFATAPDHAFVAYAGVRILDATGNEVLSTDNAGPWFFTNLPNGIYRVTATAYGRAIEQTAKIGKGEQTQVFFYW